MWKKGDIIICTGKPFQELTKNKKYTVIECYMSLGLNFVKIINDDGGVGNYFTDNFVSDLLTLRKDKIDRIRTRICGNKVI